MIEDTINIYQKKRIEERLKLNFNEEILKSKLDFERKRFIKNFINQRDIFITELYNDGVIFYGFTIEMPFFNRDPEKKWYYTHLRVEDLINYMKEKIELIEFCYISIELHEDEKKVIKSDLVLNQNNSILGVPFFKGIIGVRSLIGNNKNHFNEIKKVLNIQLNDTFIKNLNNIEAIKRYWNFVIKENNFKFHRFAQYSSYYDDLYADIADLELQYDKLEHIAFGLDEHNDALYSNLCGIKDSNPYSQTIISYLITIYMIEEKLFLLDNILYKSVDLKLVKFDSIEFLRKNNIIIFEKLKLMFPQQLNGLKIPKLFIDGWNEFFKDVKKNNHYLPHVKYEKNKN